MSSWAKQFLGWVSPTNVTANLTPASIPRFEDNSVAFRIPISGTQYYLVSNTQRVRFDTNFPTAGLAILRINETVVNSGLANNRVNADESNQGVEIMEADGRRDLDNAANRGDAGDLYPGSANARAFDNGTTPASTGNIAICDINAPADTATARILTNNGRCTTTTPPSRCSSLATMPRGPANPADWLLMLLPVFLAGIWLRLSRSSLAGAVKGSVRSPLLRP
jgi:immune inhibitor A